MDKSIDTIIKENLDPKALKQFNIIYYGRDDHCVINFSETTVRICDENELEIAGYTFQADKEENREPRIVRVGLVQHSIVLSTDSPIEAQKEAIYKKVEKFIKIAAGEGVNILCLQEAWYMPFFLCTRDKVKWSEFVEPIDGVSNTFLCNLAKKHDMVIVSPILERDKNGVWWNSAAVIDERGKIMGKHHKNHLPSVGSFDETSYYSPGYTGHPVFATKYGKIAVNICYGRHQAMNWLMFNINGAEIVFNPCATIAKFGETFWGIEARNAAVANNYFTCSINRVGTEEFSVEKDGKSYNVSRSYYGSSYVSAPDGSRTPSLSKINDGLLVVDMDLNLCRQIKDKWGFNMTARLDMYAEELSKIK